MTENDAAPAVLLTGAPGVGKSTIIGKVANILGQKAGGFLTTEVRDKDGLRSGFQIVALHGERMLLASTNPSYKSAHWQPFGRYWVNGDAVEQVAIPAIVHAIREAQVVIVDEIGPMELLSAAFCDVVWRLLDGNCPVIGTIVERPHPVADLIKQHNRVQLCVVTAATRDRLPQQVMRLTLPKS